MQINIILQVCRAIISSPHKVTYVSEGRRAQVGERSEPTVRAYCTISAEQVVEQ